MKLDNSNEVRRNRVLIEYLPAWGSGEAWEVGSEEWEEAWGGDAEVVEKEVAGCMCQKSLASS